MQSKHTLIGFRESYRTRPSFGGTSTILLNLPVNNCVTSARERNGAEEEAESIRPQHPLFSRSIWMRNGGLRTPSRPRRDQHDRLKAR